MDVEPLAGKLVSWIKDKVLTAQCKGVVLGMSGGIDSSVLAVLCHRAFPESTLGVIMPCHSSHEDEEHARAVARKFSITTRAVVLDSAFDGLLRVLPDDPVDPALTRLTHFSGRLLLSLPQVLPSSSVIWIFPSSVST